MSLEELCDQDECTIFLANFQMGVSAGGEETYNSYFQQDLTRLSNKVVSSVRWTFSSFDVGSVLRIYNASGSIYGNFTIEAVSGHQATLDSDPGAMPASADWRLNPGITQRCLIQQVSGRRSGQFDTHGQSITHKAYFSSDVVLTKRHRITWTGLYLRVLDYYRHGRPGEDMLWIADCDYTPARKETSTNQ